MAKIRKPKKRNFYAKAVTKVALKVVPSKKVYSRKKKAEKKIPEEE